MITKIISNSFNFGEATIQTIPMVKAASPNYGEFGAFIESLKPEPGHTKLLMLALGAGETYGCNRNGDYFPELALVEHHKTFEEFGHNYKHHINKDPNRSYGKVVKSYWNPRMKRVELIVDVDNSKAPDILVRVDAGELIPVSMACKVPYDICSICDNRAKTIDNYCDHLKNHMGEILPGGKQVYAVNTKPVFFDISYVIKPADRTAYVLQKVATASEATQALPNKKDIFLKSALLRKLSAIEKNLLNYGTDVTDTISKTLPEESISDEILDQLKKYPKEVALGSLAKNGIILSLSDFLKLLLPQTRIADDTLDEVRPCVSFSSLNEDDLGLPELLRPASLFSDIESLIGKLKDRFSLLPEQAGRRALQISFSSPPKIRLRIFPGGMSVGSSRSSGGMTIKKSAAQQLADVYSLYKLSGTALCPGQNDNLFLSLVVSQR